MFREVLGRSLTLRRAQYWLNSEYFIEKSSNFHLKWKRNVHRKWQVIKTFDKTPKTKKNWYPFRFISLFGVNYLERLVIRKAARRISTKAHLMWLATSISFLHFWLTDRRDSPRSVGIQQIILKSCSFWHIADKGVFQIERSCSDWGNWNWLGIGFGKRVNFLIIWRMCSIFGVIFAFSPYSMT